QHFTIEQQAQLIATHGTDTYTVIPAAAQQAYYPVSSAQKRLYILSHLEGGDLSYNMPGVLTVEGPLQADRLEDAFRQLIARHETLRTSFEMLEGEVV
ncbi:condensation domain-containing protein, partial [Paenibacillus polymyxa]